MAAASPLLLANPIPANDFCLEKGQEIKAGGKSIRLGSTICPDIVDWNEDGKMDILAGTFRGGGEVFVLINKGSNEKPEFEMPKQISAGGKTIRVSGW